MAGALIETKREIRETSLEIERLSVLQKQALVDEAEIAKAKEEMANRSRIAKEAQAAEDKLRRDNETEDKLIKQETDKTNETLFQQSLKDLKNQAQMDEANNAIAIATTREQKLAAIKKKAIKKDALIRAEQLIGIRKNIKDEKLQKLGMLEFSKMVNSQELAAKQQVFSQIATLANSQSKTLAAIGKAAAIANIIINTARGVQAALVAFIEVPPVAYALAGAVAASGAAQIAAVNGVQLAEGGIVRSSQGGTRATIGEGGRDEAVIPLDDSDSPIGTTINITVNGGLLGDEVSAKEFAIAIDREFVKLRQNNESNAFDQGLI